MVSLLWANQIMLGRKTFDEVPRLLREQVKQILVDAGMEHLAR